MPKKPQRACQHPGCPKLTDSLYCAEHQQQATRHYNRFQRDPESNKCYGRAWKRIRDRYIKAHPLCEQCEKDGLLAPAEEVHHILPLSHGGTNNTSNLMALCKPCHSRITAESGDRWGRSNL
jgi:5-methylcytosine-specific restriction protein A